jgi:two-component system CheB/CheR fusion protein
VRDSNDAVLVQDFAGRILAWNPAAERMYGWSEAQALELNIKDIVPPGRHEETLGSVKQLSRGEAVHPHKTQRLKKDGCVLEVWITYSELLNEAGEPYAVATTEKDIPATSTAKDGIH